MAAQTPPPGAKIIDLVDVIEEQNGSINDDDLDALLADLEKPAKSGMLEVSIDDDSDTPVDDLDSLLEELEGTTPAAAVAPQAGQPASQPVQAQPEDAFDPSDLDELLEQLAADAPKEKAGQEPDFNVSELDDLLNELQPPAAAPAEANVLQTGGTGLLDSQDLDSLLAEIANPPSEQAVTHAAKEKPALKDKPALAENVSDDLEDLEGLASMDDLDMLLADLGSGPALEAKDPAPTGPEPVEQPDALADAQDDLDALLADLESNTPADPPLPEVIAEQTGDDLDTLLADFEKKPLEPAAPEATAQDDLDALLADFEEKPLEPAAPEATAQDDLDALLADFEEKPLEPAAPEATAQDDLDALLADFAENELISPDNARLPGAAEKTDSLLSGEAMIASLAPGLDAATVREIYAATLRSVLEQVIPEMVAKEVARQVEAEIQAIKALARED